MKKTLFQNIRIIDGNLNINSNKDLLIDENSILEISEPFSIKNPDYELIKTCLLYTSPSPRDPKTSRMPSSA